MDARRAFLSGLIDDAGLFPPASLGMAEAVRAHVEARSGPHGWMLGRFICPASRLKELVDLIPGDDRWRLSVILDADTGWAERIDQGLAAIEDFQRTAGGSAQVELLEAPLPPNVDAADARLLLDRVADAALPPVRAHLEVRPDEIRRGIEALAALEAPTVLGAKLRCGGAGPDLIPSPEAVAAFIDGCRRSGIALKATAGLHHPFRHIDAASATVQHGFVNVVGAAVLARVHDLDEQGVGEIVAERDPEAFEISGERFAWRGLAADADETRAARSDLFVAYGSCSFAEPVEDLLALEVLPA